MGLVNDAVRAYIGVTSETEFACDAVEPGAVRRYSQAIMDEHPAYVGQAEENAKYGGAVAPPLYPMYMFRRPFGTPDPIEMNADNPDFDGIGATAAQGLPEIEPFRGLALLNGGTEVEFYRYARYGENVKLRSHYVDISEKETSKGPMAFVVIETEYSTADGEVLLRARRTQIRR